MKKLATLTLLSVLCATSLLAQNNSSQVRISQLFNFGWKFQAGDIPDAQNPSFNDADWRLLDLPHDFQIEQPWDKGASRGRGFKAMGIGWYRNIQG
jgi:beta-galactosidase